MALRDLGLSIDSSGDKFPHFLTHSIADPDQKVLVQTFRSVTADDVKSSIRSWSSMDQTAADELWIVGTSITRQARSMRFRDGIYLLSEFELRELRGGRLLDSPDRYPRSLFALRKRAPIFQHALLQQRVEVLLTSTGHKVEVSRSFPDMRVTGLDLFPRPYCFIECLSRVDSARLLEVSMQWPYSPERYECLLVVANEIISNASHSRLAPNIALMTYTELEEFVTARTGYRTEPEPTPPPPPTRIAKTIAANKQSILVNLMGLALILRNRLDEMRALRGNSPEHQERIDEYEALLARVEALEKAVRTMKVREPKKVAEPVNGFRHALGTWWSKNHESVLNNSTNTAIFVTAITLLGLTNGVSWVGELAAAGLASGKVSEVFDAIGRRLPTKKK